MIIIKTQSEIKAMREGGKILATILYTLLEKCREGVQASDIEKEARKLMKEHGSEPSFENYQGYKYATCISVNDEVVHAFPLAKKIFKDGDVVTLDIGVRYKGMCTDMARTIGIGKVSEAAARLMQVTEESLQKGIAQVRAGRRIGDISAAIQKHIEGAGFGVVRALVGHGVGKYVHEDPRVPNYGKEKTGLVLEEGMTIAIEPMVTLGDYEVYTANDDWTVRTVDGSLSAHSEDSLLVTKEGYEIFTKV